MSKKPSEEHPGFFYFLGYISALIIMAVPTSSFGGWPGYKELVGDWGLHALYMTPLLLFVYFLLVPGLLAIFVAPWFYVLELIYFFILDFAKLIIHRNKQPL